MIIHRLIIGILLVILLIAPASAAAGDTILSEQVTISKNITQIWNNGSFQVYPVVEGVTSSDNIDQLYTSGQSIGGIGVVSSIYYFNAQSFTAAKSQLVSVAFNQSGQNGAPIGDVLLEIRSDDAIKPSNTIISSTTVPNTSWTTGYYQFSVPAVLTPGLLYWITVRNATVQPAVANSGFYQRFSTSGSYPYGNYSYSTNGGSTWTLVPNTDLDFITYYAKNTESVNVTVNGNTTMLDTGDATGLLSGATVDTYNGTYRYYKNLGTAEKINEFSNDVYSASFGGGYSSTRYIIYGWTQHGGAGVLGGKSALSENIILKVNTILPFNQLNATVLFNTDNSWKGNLSISHDGTTFSPQVSASGGGGSVPLTVSLAGNGNSVAYIRISNVPGSYIVFHSVSINATLNTTSSNATVLTYQTGVNTINITSYGNAVSSSLDPSLMANVSLIEGASGVVMPIVQWFTDKTTVVFPGRVKVNDTSLNSPTWWNYSMGDGNVTNISSVDQKNFSYQYTKRGVWPAQLTVSNSAGSNTSAAINIRVIGYASLTPEKPKTCQYSTSRDLDILEKAMVECQLCQICER